MQFLGKKCIKLVTHMLLGNNRYKLETRNPFTWQGRRYKTLNIERKIATDKKKKKKKKTLRAAAIAAFPAGGKNARVKCRLKQYCQLRQR